MFMIYNRGDFDDLDNLDNLDDNEDDAFINGTISLQWSAMTVKLARRGG